MKKEGSLGRSLVAVVLIGVVGMMFKGAFRPWVLRPPPFAGWWR
jgi:hypothetical protein